MSDYIGTHGISEDNDRLFTAIQLTSGKVIRRTPFYQAAIAVARSQYDGIPRAVAFNMALRDLLDAFGHTRKAA